MASAKDRFRAGGVGVFTRWAARLRFPYLFALTSFLFLLNIFVPDVIPFADEVLMGLAALLLGNLRKTDGKRAEPSPARQKDGASPD